MPEQQEGDQGVKTRNFFSRFRLCANLPERGCRWSMASPRRRSIRRSPGCWKRPSLSVSHVQSEKASYPSTAAAPGVRGVEFLFDFLQEMPRLRPPLPLGPNRIAGRSRAVRRGHTGAFAAPDRAAAAGESFSSGSLRTRPSGPSPAKVQGFKACSVELPLQLFQFLGVKCSCLKCMKTRRRYGNRFFPVRVDIALLLDHFAMQRRSRKGKVDQDLPERRPQFHEPTEFLHHLARSWYGSR